MTQYPDLFAALAAPFQCNEVRTKPGQGGSGPQNYITARNVMNRLDDVVGPENWWDDYTVMQDSVACRLSIRLPGGQVLVKSDAGGYADMKDAGDGEKAGFSDALKRAAVKFGVGRYLYGEPRHQPKVPSQTPEPKPALVTREVTQKPPQVAKAPPQAPAGINFTAIPKAGGGAFFHWARDVGTHFSVDLASMVSGIAKQEGLPYDWRSWDQPLIDSMYARIVAYCKRTQGYRGEFDGAEGAELSGLRAATWLRACTLQERISPGEVITPENEDVKMLIWRHSGQVITSLAKCNDRAVLVATIEKLKEAAREVEAGERGINEVAS